MAIEILQKDTDETKGWVVQISHRMNGVFNDVLIQEVDLLRGINQSGLWGSEAKVGLFSYDRNVQPDTSLRRKFGFWSENFSLNSSTPLASQQQMLDIPLKVNGGISFLGLKIFPIGDFDDLVQLAQKLPVSWIFWTSDHFSLAAFFCELAEKNNVLFVEPYSQHFIFPRGLISEICRNSSSVFCKPSFDVDVYGSEVEFLDPFEQLRSYFANIEHIKSKKL